MNVEYERGYNRAKKDFKKKIDETKKDLTVLDNIKIDGEVFTIAVNFTKKILQEILKEE